MEATSLTSFLTWNWIFLLKRRFQRILVVSGPAAMIVGTADEARRSCRVRDTRRRCCSSLLTLESSCAPLPVF